MSLFVQTNHFNNLPALQRLALKDAATNELDRYLNSAIVNVEDAITWWKDNQDTYPRLSQMAIDHLTIPGACNAIQYY